MKLNELYKKPLSELVGQMYITEIKPHTGDDGEIYSVEIKYVPEGAPKEPTNYTAHRG